MNAIKIQETLINIEKNMSELAPYRKSTLFKEFLLKGYTAVTLNSVPNENFNELLQAKICLGTLITLYDDFADRPSVSNPQLLEILYELKFGKNVPARNLNPHDRLVFDFARSLFKEMEDILTKQPHFHQLIEIINFDLTQFYCANQYSSLVTAHPFINNLLENRLYTHHNMGMVMVGMMDLIATEKIEISELSLIREIFLMGQRMGRIFNVLSTHNREVIDGDITGELSTFKNTHEIQIAKIKLRQEILNLHERILSFDSQITTFSVKVYLEGLMKVKKLYEKMEGVI